MGCARATAHFIHLLRINAVTPVDVRLVKERIRLILRERVRAAVLCALACGAETNSSRVIRPSLSMSNIWNACMMASCAAVCLASALLGRRPSGEFGMLSWLWSGSGRTVCAERFGRIALPRLCRDVCFSGAVLLNFRFFNRLRC